MQIPETTSAEAFERYVGGKCLRASSGKAWQDIKAWIIAPERHTVTVPLPAVSEPFLAWSISGEVDFQEREGAGPWITNRIKKGSFFLTSGGAPYECRWKTVTAEPFLSMHVSIELPLLQRALEEVFGADAAKARLKNLSAFTDSNLDWLMERLHEELMRRRASPLSVRGLAQAIAVHLARNYAEVIEEPRSLSPSLPGFKLNQITGWMAEHLAEEFHLDRLAAQASLSKFHFIRLFKAATGLSPSHYLQNLRMNEGINGIDLVHGRKSIAGSMIRGIAETQEVIDYCAARRIKADIELIRPADINHAYERVVNKDVRYRFVIDLHS